MDNFDLRKYLAEGRMHEVFGMFHNKVQLYIPK